MTAIVVNKKTRITKTTARSATPFTTDFKRIMFYPMEAFASESRMGKLIAFFAFGDFIAGTANGKSSEVW